MAVQFLNPDGMMKSPAFSQVVTTSGSGKTIYVGGQNAVNEKGETVGKGDIAAQTEQVMVNIDKALKAAGAAFKDIIKMNIYITQGQDIRKGFEASQRFFKDNVNQPVITGLFVAGIGDPDYLVEVEAVAFVEG